MAPTQSNIRNSILAFLTEEQLEQIGFKSFGTNVRISDKAAIYNPEQVEIGNNSRIDDFCVISGKVSIMGEMFM